MSQNLEIDEIDSVEDNNLLDSEGKKIKNKQINKTENNKINKFGKR